MPTLESSLTIEVPPAKVYDAFVDLSRWLEWNPHFREVRPLTEGLLTTDSTARIALKLSPFASVWEVTNVIPGHSFAWVSSSIPGVRLTFDHIAEPADGGTKATLRIDIDGPLAFLGTLAAPLYSRNLSHSLAALKRLLEAEAGSTPQQQQPPTEEPAAAAPAEEPPPPAAEEQPEDTPEGKAEPKNQ